MRKSKTLMMLVLALWATRSYAVDGTGIKIAEKWSVVGVISEGDATSQSGVAVIRNNQTRATHTLKIGDGLPTEFGFVLKAVEGRRVLVSNGKDTVTLTFAEGSSSDDSDSQSVTARFIDNYYRGLGEGGVEDEGAATFGTQVSESGLQLPLRRFGPYTAEQGDAARSRFDLYRTDRPYRQGETMEGDGDGNEAAAVDESGFIVNYDNFEDVPQNQGTSFEEWVSEE